MTSSRPFAMPAPTRAPGARIVGVGAAQPEGVVSAADLTAPFGKTAEWLAERTGIRQLRRIRPDEDLLDLAETAAVKALADAGLDLAQVDAIIVATCSGSPAGRPALSARLATRLRTRAQASDLNAACAGFCFALSQAAAQIDTGAADVVLVVGAEQMSGMVDPADLGTSILFGDGAGAAVVARAPDGRPGIGPPAWSSDGDQRGVLEILDGETCLRMAGPKVFRWAVDEVHQVARAAIAGAGLVESDIDVFVPHQANLRIVDAIARKLNLGNATTATDVIESGNTSAASIPIALDRLRRAGSVHPGQRALFVGFGAGLAIAAQVVVLP